MSDQLVDRSFLYTDYSHMLHRIFIFFRQFLSFNRSKNTIQSSIIGALQQHYEFDDQWVSKRIPIPFFNNKKCAIIFSCPTPTEDTNFLAEADAALYQFLKKSTPERESISHLVYQNYIDSLDIVEHSTSIGNIQDKNKIWNFVYLTEIFVTRRHYNEQDIYVQVLCECKWEKEHGLQLVFRQGKQIIPIAKQNDAYLPK